MVNFGVKILEKQHKPWSQYYLDYNRLKELLEEDESRSLASFISLGSDDMAQHAVNNDFVSNLNAQVEDILLFYLRKQGEIADAVDRCRRQHRQWINTFPRPPAAPPDLAKTLVQEYKQVAIDLLHLIQFVEINMTAIRKILKKHDKLKHSSLTGAFLNSKSAHMAPMLQNEDISSLIFILERSYNELQAIIVTAPPPPAIHGRRNTLSTFLHLPLLSTSSSNIPLPTPRSSRFEYRKKFEHMHPESDAVAFEQSVDWILWQIHGARSKLEQTSEFVSYLGEILLLGDSEEDEGLLDEQTDEALPGALSNVLNLLSTFMYMTNYYIVAPTSGDYASKLGGSEALSGMIIGMTPVAALVSTVLYSYWTNYSYKSALIFASTCSLIGNLLYALGLPNDSLLLVMVGRLLNGFGSARSINRRYIADTFAKSERTAASAAFVTAGALGMAAGPAFASMLHFSVQERSTNRYWQAENSPGWLMFGLWILYLICLINYFQDPPKRVSSPVRTSRKEVEMTIGENQPLLEGVRPPPADEEPPIWQNIPVIVTFFVYFVLKLVLECVLSSLSIVTKFYFAWSGSVAGVYMACLGLFMLPANLLVSRLSRLYTDRELILGLAVFMLLGCLSILQYTHEYDLPQYLVSSVVIFLSTNALEGPNMSLLSKTIPKSWTKGLFNVGLLATEAGTLGRAIGDAFLTYAGSQGLDLLLNYTFVTMAMLSVLSVGLTVRFYAHLVVKEKDD